MSQPVAQAPQARGDAALRIANMSARREDRAGAMRDFIAGSQFDVLAMDLLSDVAMVRLAEEVSVGGDGFETTFLTQLEYAVDMVAGRGVTIVTNAGALAPETLAAKVSELLAARGTDIAVSWIDAGECTPDQLAGQVPAGEPEPKVATVSYGAFGIAHALDGGAQIVITGRVSREALVLGAAIAHHRWTRDNLDALAGAVAVGHVISGGPGATGRSFSDFPTILESISGRLGTLPGETVVARVTDGGEKSRFLRADVVRVERPGKGGGAPSGGPTSTSGASTPARASALRMRPAPGRSTDPAPLASP